MKCKKIKELVYTVSDSGTDMHDKNIIDKHISTCDSCREEYNTVKKIVSKVRAIPEADVPAGFEGRVIERIVYVRKRSIKRFFYPAFYFAMGAAVVLLVFSFKGGFVNSVRYISEDNMAVLADYSSRKVLFKGDRSYIKLDMNSSKYLENVSMEIIMPEGLVLSNNKTIAKWRGNLRKGHNVILLEVNGQVEGAWDIEGLLRKNGLQKRFKRKVMVI